jgi:hypothetical protein
MFGASLGAAQVRGMFEPLAIAAAILVTTPILVEKFIPSKAI